MGILRCESQENGCKANEPLQDSRYRLAQKEASDREYVNLTQSACGLNPRFRLWSRACRWWDLDLPCVAVLPKPAREGGVSI